MRKKGIWIKIMSVKVGLYSAFFEGLTEEDILWFTIEEVTPTLLDKPEIRVLLKRFYRDRGHAKGHLDETS